MVLKLEATGERRERAMAFSKLPGDVISRIISFTTPKDACRASSISTSFRSAAVSDQVWLQFLPPDCNIVIPQISSKKSLFLHLCDHPTPVGNNRNMTFSLERKSGKKCFMIGAREMVITWGNDRRYWRWIDEPNSRFDQVARLVSVCWFDIIGRIETKMLSPRTTYVAYLVFKFKDSRTGFYRAVTSRVSVESDEHKEWPTVILDPLEGERRSTRERGDGWLEIEMGEFHNENGDEGTLVCHLKEVDNDTWKSGLIVEGIELRPKEIP